jgi:hypothetical protein
MGYKFEILATNYPFKGYYEASYRCETFWSALKKFREYRHLGYEIIDVHYRGIKEQFTWAFVDDLED